MIKKNSKRAKVVGDKKNSKRAKVVYEVSFWYKASC